jgi:hypothetical protein
MNVMMSSSIDLNNYEQNGKISDIADEKTLQSDENDECT